MTCSRDSQSMAGADNIEVRHVVKSCLWRMFPDRVAESILRRWRQVYWWNKGRIRPARNRRVVREAIGSGLPINLELGSWKRPKMEGWITSDINGSGDLQLDLTHAIPFPDDSVEKIYSSHLLEHFSYPSPMLDLLQECRRILKPCGVFSIAVPDARLFLDAYYDDRQFEREKFCAYDVGLTYKNRMDYVNFIAYLGGEHKHLFDRENLITILQEVGFSEVTLRNFDPLIDLEERRHESIYAQGTI